MRSAFLVDLRRSLGAWRSYPMLPLTAIAVWAVPTIIPDDTLGGALALLILTIEAGWAGTERAWYLRAFWGLDIQASEVIALVRMYMWRFIKLGLLVGVVLVPAFVIPAILDRLVLAIGLSLALGVVVDIMLTFVTPALTFTTRSVVGACRSGMRLLKRQWPASALYAIPPPFAVLLLSRILPQEYLGGVWGDFGFATIATVVNLLFKGASAGFYLRHESLHPKSPALAVQPALPQ